MTPTHTLRVLTVRSQNPIGIGGCIFTGAPIDAWGNIQDAKSYFVIKASGSLLGSARIQPGQWWRIQGEEKLSAISVNGYTLNERQVEAEGAELLLPSGEHIVSFMAESDAFKGIGWVKARKLWETFGERLYNVLDRGDVSTLASVLSEESAQQVIAAWALHGDTRTLQWLHQAGIDVALGRKVISFFGPATAGSVEEDPYRLLSFCATWKQVDTLARMHFDIAEDDPRRLQGAIEEACYRVFSIGHTTASLAQLFRHLESILGVQSDHYRWRELVPEALVSGYTNGSYVVDADLTIYPLGPRVMEATVAQSICARLLADHPLDLLTEKEVDAILVAYEAAEGITLNKEQRLAVQTAAANAFTLITGGAGVGKTTVLKALHQVYDRAGLRIFQVALAGRAAKRMQEATGRAAMTLAGFLRNVKDEEFAAPAVVVVDEASMVDIITMHRLCERLPAHVRLVLVGDPSQLMPVGPGLVLHALAQLPQVPNVELLVVKRHGGALGAAALAIRDGNWPELPGDDTADIAFIPRATKVRREGADTEFPLAKTVLGLYEQNPEATQILSARRNGPDGTKGLNALCQAKLTKQAQPLMVWSEPFEAWAHTGFHLGDPVICTRNRWDQGLQNGSLGKLVQVEDTPRLITNQQGEEVGYAIAWVEWDDGERRPVFEEMLDDLELGYAITTHKAQGSQWPRVIVCITGNRLLDRTLVYTAVSRAQHQVILVGDVVAARKAVEAVPKAHYRQVALGQLTRQQLELS